MKACLASVPMPTCEVGRASILAACSFAAALPVGFAAGLAGGFCGCCFFG